jgi:hypothetical protein
MGYLFVTADDMADLSSITTFYSNLLKAKGSVWHKSSMKKRLVPRSGIDTDSKWGYSHTKEGWVFGYKLHLTCTAAIDEIVIPLTADVTISADVPDNRMYIPSTSYSLVFSLPYLMYMIADPSYNDKNL